MTIEMEDVLVGLLLIILGIMIGMSLDNQEVKVIPMLSTNYSDCGNLDLINTTYCLQNELSNWYNYNLSNVKANLTLPELKTSGGVCWHYAKYYQDNFINFGYNSKLIDFNGEDVGHEITLAWTNNLSDGAYCIADQLSIFCNRFVATNVSLVKQEVEK